MANKFKEKQILADVLNDLYEAVDTRERAVHLDYRVVGEVQATDWRTGELKWEDEEKTIPKMVPKYENVRKDESELTDDDRLKIKVYQYVKTQLEKMI